MKGFEGRPRTSHTRVFDTNSSVFDSFLAAEMFSRTGTEFS